nr:hypothetical protein [uncultured Roseateles sp.]
MDTSRWIGLALAAGAWSGVLSAAALMGASRANGDRTPTGLNGPSHWFFGEPAVHAQRFSVRHTVVGALTHQASSFLWSAVFASTRLRPAAAAHGHARIAAEAALVSAVAAAVDLLVVPRRLTPGFERRLSAKALAAVYASFAFGLAVAAVRERRAPPPSRLRAATCPSPHSTHPPGSARCPAPRR